MCFIQCTLRKSIRPSPNKISILYINNWTIDQSAKIATVVKNEKSTNPTLVLINGKLFSSSPFTDLSEGRVVINILNASQIDAVLFTPDFLRWGIQQCQELVRNADFYCLGANIKDRVTNQTFGQEFLLKALGKSQIAILGVNYDSSNYYFKDKTIEFDNPKFTILKLLPLVENHTDFQFILTQSQDSLDLPVDLIFGAPTKSEVQLLPFGEPGIYKIDIGFNNLTNITEIKRTTVLLDTIQSDTLIKKIITDYQTKLDSLLKIKINTPTNDLNKWVIESILDITKSQSFASNQPLVAKQPSSNKISFGDFYNVLNEKDIIPILKINGNQLKDYKKFLTPSISPISANKNYQILTTNDFLNLNSELRFESVEYTNLTIWKMVSNYLEKSIWE